MLNLTLIVLFFVHCFVAAQFGLAHDEAYYHLFSKNLAWGYFDHPPMVALAIRSFGFLATSELSVRLAFIIMQLLSVFYVVKLLPENRKWVGFLLFFSFPLASFSGLLALPDMPLLFFSVLYCYYLKSFLEKNDWKSSILLALIIPALLYSKYHGILLIFFTILAVPKLLKNKKFWAIAFLSLILFLPHLYWQYEHEFATLRYHFFERPKAKFRMSRMIEYVSLQVFLAGLFAAPIVWYRVTRKTLNDFDKAMKWISLGTVIFFFISTISKRFEANWTVFLTPCLVYLGAQSNLWDRVWAKRILITSFFIVFGARFLFPIDPSVSGLKRLHEFHGWDQFSKQVEIACGEQPMMANTYQIASKLAFYTDAPVHALNFNSRKNHFDFWARNASYYKSNIVCYVSDNKQLGGVEVLTPEKTKLTIVKNFNLQSVP